MGGTHRKGERRRRWSIAFAGLLIMAAGVAGAVAIGAMVGFGPLATCSPVEVVVAADRAVVEPVTRALDRNIATPTDVGTGEGADTGCVRYRVVEAAADLPSAIRAGEPGLPAVWIPDSALALDTLDSATGALVTQGPSLASSPVVVAVPAGDADRYGEPAATVPWFAMLASATPPALPEPTLDRSALAGLTALRIAIGDDSGKPRPEFIGAVLALAGGRLPDPAAGFAAVDGDDSGAFIASEQAVLRHNREGKVPVAALTVQGGAGALDFPFVRVAAGIENATMESGRSTPEMAAAVNALETELRGPTGHDVLAAAGLRAPDGSRPADASADVGWLAPNVPTADPRARHVATETLGLWNSLTLPSRMLAVIDVSGSMNSPASEGARRIDLAAGAARGGLALLPDVSSVGMWAFSEKPPPEDHWQELVPLGPLTDPFEANTTRREAINARVGQLPGLVDGGTALYDTALAAVRSVRASYEPGAAHSIVLMTDGRNEVEGGVDLPALLDTLQQEADPEQPVLLITIGIGPDADVAALRQISEVTGSRSYTALAPDDIQAVFFDALSQRVCRPVC